MGSNDDVKFKVGAEDTGVAAVMAQVEAAISSSAERIKATVEGISEAFEAVNAAFVAIAAVVAGGEAFKDAISSTVSLNTESVKLGKQFGISATEASQLKVALGATFLTQDQVSSAAGKIDQALKKNESAFTELGVATRDANGNFRSTLDIMLDTNARLSQFQEGTDRNVEGIKIYSRAWGEISETLRLTPEAMDAAKEAADALGLTVGTESVAATQRYRSAMNDVHEVLEGIENAIGQALMPALSSIGEWFGSIGPSVVSVIRGSLQVLGTVLSSIGDAFKAMGQLALDVLGQVGQLVVSVFGGDSISTMEFFLNVIRAIEVAFIGLRTGIQETAQIVGAGFELMAAAGRMFARVIKSALTFDWKSADAAFDSGAQEMQKIWDQRANNMVGIAEKARQDIDKALLAPVVEQQTTTPTQAPQAGAHSAGGPDKNLMAELEAKLSAFKANYTQQLAAQGEFQEFSKQMEHDYWAAVLQETNLSTAQRLQVERKVGDLSVAIAKDGFQGQLAAMKAQENEYKSNLQARLQIAEQYAQKIAQAEGGDSKAAQEAQAQVLAIQREIAAQNLQIATTAQKAMDDVHLAGIDQEEAKDKERVTNFKETERQLLDNEREYENERYQIKLQALQRELSLEAQSPDRNPAKLAQINAQILALQTQHEAQMQKLSQQTTQLTQQYWTNTFKAMSSGFTTAIAGFLKGTETFTQAVRSMGQTMLNAMINTFAQILTNWIETQIIQLITGKSTSAGIIGGHAAEAGAAAFAATAAIPYVGPELAPAAGAAAYAEAMAFQGMAAAEQGYDVPAGVNPFTQLHQKEMVLPADLAEGARRTFRAGDDDAGGGRRGDTHNHNYSIHTMDSRGVEKFLASNHRAVAKAMEKHLNKSGYRRR